MPLSLVVRSKSDVERAVAQLSDTGGDDGHIAERRLEIHAYYNYLLEERCTSMLRQAAYSNGKITTVTIFGLAVGEGDPLAHKAARTVYEAFGSLPSLKNLRIHGSCRGMARVISRMLRKSSQSLEALHLSNVLLDGEVTDFVELAASLRRHGTLKEFHLNGCTVSESTLETAPAVFNQVLLALTTISSLERVLIIRNHSSCLGQLSNDTFEALCSSSSVKSLKLYGMPEFVPTICRALSRNNNGVMIELLVQYPCTTPAQCDDIARLIHRNSTLKKLGVLSRIGENYDDDDTALVGVAAALATNNTLRSFHFTLGRRRTGFSATTQQAFLDMLKVNYSLWDLGALVIGHQQDYCRHYLQLNRRFRTGLLQQLQDANMVPEQWLETVESIQDDLDSLFYCLKEVTPFLAFWQSNVSEFHAPKTSNGNNK